MDGTNYVSQSSTLSLSRRSFNCYEGLVLGIPNFSTIERFLLVGGGNADEIYDRMMAHAYPKGADIILNIMDELNNKSSQNLEVTRTITGFNGLFGLHDSIFEKKYKGANDLIFWVNGSVDLHDIVKLPTSIDQLLLQGEQRTFNFFESLYPLNIKIEAQNGLSAAFQFWKIPKVIMRFDEVMEEFLYNLTDFDRNPENITHVTGIGMTTMLKAICDVQRTILASPRGIVSKDEFFDNKVEHLRSLGKRERDDILTLELKKILWELLIPPEFFITLFQKELDNESFVVEKFQYRRRKNLLIIYRGLQFLLEYKFEMLINIDIVKHIIFPTLKEIVMEEYLPDITNDMMVCLIKAGSVFIRSEIWKFFLIARDGYTREVIKKSPKRSKGNKKDDLAFQDEPLQKLCKKQESSISENTVCLKSNKEAQKAKSVKRKTKPVMKKSLDSQGSGFICEKEKEKEKSQDIMTENKLVTTKPWFSKSLMSKNQDDCFKSNSLSDSCESFGFRPSSEPFTSQSKYIYDNTDNVTAKSSPLKSLPTVNSFGNRIMRPRIAEDKISK